MKIIFFGTADFAVPTLQALIESKHEVVLVVTQPDRKSGRGLKLEFSPVKQLSLKHNLKTAQPEKLDPSIYEGCSVEIGVALAYGKIIKQDVLDHLSNGVLGVHPSLLPRYRGAAPVNWALLNGESETGMTIYRLDKRMDAGEIIAQHKVPISEDDDAQVLLERLSKLGASMLVESIDAIEQGEATFTPQDESQATIAPKLNKEQSHIDWTKPAIEIQRQIKALTPWPSTATIWKGVPLKICQAKAIDSKASQQPGEVIGIEADALVVSTGKGSLSVSEVQLPGKKQMGVGEFLRGHRVIVGEILGQ